MIIGPAESEAAPAIDSLIVQQAYQAQWYPDREPSLPFGVGWNGYVHLASGPMTISGFPLVPSYGGLMKVTQGLTRKIDGPLAMAADTIRLFGWQMYFIEAHAMDKGAVLTSPSAPYALYVARGQASCFAKVDLPGPALATRAGLEHRSGTTRYEEIERLALARLDKLDLRRGPGDISAVDRDL